MRLSISLRRYVAIAALVALSVLLVQPVCDVLGLHPASSHAAPMALMHHDAGAGAATVADSAKAGSLAAAPVAAVLAVLAAVVLSAVAAPRDAPPPSGSYYTRSARILR